MSTSPVWALLTPHEKSSRDSHCAEWARGERIGFMDGSVKLCGRSGLWNTNLGYGNEVVADAARDALLHASYLPVWGFNNVYARKAATALIAATGRADYERVLFSTSGGAANDAAMKLARQFQHLRGTRNKSLILGLKGGYHGLTFGSFALSDVSLGNRIYGIDRRTVGHIEPNSVGALNTVLSSIGPRVAAIFIEPVIGNGAVVLSDAFLDALFQGRQRHGYLLVCDEVATGFGRVGPDCFVSQGWNEAPDVVITAKGMTNGTQAASALIIASEVVRTFDDSSALLAHAETQAGTPIVCASTLATLAEMERLDALNHAAGLSSHIEVALDAFSDNHGAVAGISGRGCMWSVDLDPGRADATTVDAVVDAIFDAGAMVHPGPSSLLLMPALTYTDDLFDELLDIVGHGLRRVLPN